MLVQAIDLFLNDIKEFESYVPLAVSLRVEAMNGRHSDELPARCTRDTPRTTWSSS